ncbi:MAG TPA: hypothetical protein ENO21_02875 [Firmicutes bacterium]|nr:hypothetical protein [Bacillota bacterium]
MYYYHVHPGGVNPIGELADLTLAVADDEVLIGHHQAQLEFVKPYPESAEKYWSLTAAPLGETALSLAELRRDSDADGLTDVMETLLLTDPHSADTDGDGRADAADAAPLVDAAAMNQLERGTARALTYYFQVLQYNEGWWTNSNPSLPYRVRYLDCRAAGRVAYAAPGAQGICLDTEDRYQRYSELLSGYNSYSGVQVGAVGRNDLFGPELSDLGMDAAMLNAVSSGNPFYEDLIELDCEHFVLLDFALHGELIFMIEVQGELYPLKFTQTWIS